MTEIKFTVKTLATFCGMTITELAEKAGIKPAHLLKVSCGQARMLGDDLVRLAEATGVSPFAIKTN